MTVTCAICLETNGTIYTGYHNGCIFKVHRDCFDKWYILNRTCIICREPVTDITRPSLFIGSILLSITIMSYVMTAYYMAY